MNKQKAKFIKNFSRFIKKAQRKAQIASCYAANKDIFILMRVLYYPPFMWNTTKSIKNTTTQQSIHKEAAIKKHLFQKQKLIQQAKTFILVSTLFYDGIAREWGQKQAIPSSPTHQYICKNARNRYLNISYQHTKV